MDTPESLNPGQQPQATADAPRGKSALREWLETIIIALIIALVARHFVVQVYKVSGESMNPTLFTGDRLLVNKLIYRFRSPQPGEIVVLTDPTDPRRQLIKRVIASAGETVGVKDGVAYVNGQPIREPYKNALHTVYPDREATVVPEGHIFVMGDNRGESWDSRDMGPISLDLVHGEAFFLFWPSERFAHRPLEQQRTFE